MKGLRFFLVGCALLTAYGAASLWRDRHNTLEQYNQPGYYNRWISVKTELGMGVNGAHSFTLTPVTLLGRALNLAAWHSQQEVRHLSEWLELPKIRFRVLAEGPSEVTVFARTPGKNDQFGIRFSNRPARPSAWFKVGPDRETSGRLPINFKLPEGRWVDFEIKKEADELRAFADGAIVSVQPWPSGRRSISFHGHSEAGKLKIDDIEIGPGGLLYGTTFSGRFPYVWFVVGAVLLSFLLLALQRFAGMRAAFSTALALATFSALALATYDSLIGNQYPRWVPLPGKSTIESREQVLARLAELAPSGKPVLLWLGGSQAWGAGASRAEKSAFARLAVSLGSNVEPVNGAISAATLEDQLEPLRVVSTRRRVEAVVLTTGVNDALNDAFPEKLRLVASAVRQRGAKLLLVLEPVDQPVPEAIRKRQAELRAFAAAEKLPLVDLQPALDREADSGYLWWDFVHLSDAGAAIVAAELLEPVKRLLSAPR